MQDVNQELIDSRIRGILENAAQDSVDIELYKSVRAISGSIYGLETHQVAPIFYTLGYLACFAENNEAYTNYDVLDAFDYWALRQAIPLMLYHFGKVTGRKAGIRKILNGDPVPRRDLSDNLRGMLEERLSSTLNKETIVLMFNDFRKRYSEIGGVLDDASFLLLAETEGAVAATFEDEYRKLHGSPPPNTDFVELKNVFYNFMVPKFIHNIKELAEEYRAASDWKAGLYSKVMNKGRNLRGRNTTEPADHNSGRLPATRVQVNKLYSAMEQSVRCRDIVMSWMNSHGISDPRYFNQYEASALIREVESLMELERKLKR